MKEFLLLLFSFFYSCLSFAQAPAIEWQKSFGGSNSDYPYSVQQTSDGGYVIAGNTRSNDGYIDDYYGNGDCWIVKIDNLGNIQWKKSFGGTGGDVSKSIEQTTDGGFIVAGFSSSNDIDVSGNHGYRDFWIIKLNNNGEIIWQKSLGGSNHDWANSIEQTNDGGYIITGWSASNDGDVSGNHGGDDCWVVKLDNVGNILWQNSFGGTGNETATSIHQTNDGGYIFAGYSNSDNGDVTENKGSNDFWIVKLNENGNIQWQKSFGGTAKDDAFSIQQTIDDGYIVAGTSGSINGDIVGHYGGTDTLDFWLVKLDTAGIIQWQKSLGGTNYDVAYSVELTIDGGFIVGGYSKSIDGDVSGNHGGYNCNGLCPDFWVAKIDSGGNIQWQKSLGGTNDDQVTSIQQTNDGGYIVAGWSQSDNGNITGNNGYIDFWIVKLAGPTGIQNPESKNEISIYSLANNQLNITLSTQTQQPTTASVYNLLGEVITSATFNSQSFQLQLPELPASVLLVRVTSNEFDVTKKIVVDIE